MWEVTIVRYTNSGLTLGQEYFYTVKTVRADGESAPSLEDSDIPDPGAVPWDSDNAATITGAVAAWFGGATPDLIRVVGPDGTVYCSLLGVLRPGGSVDLGTLQPGTDIVHYLNGTNIPLTDDGGEFGIDEEQPGMQVLSVDKTEVTPYTDGPLRRVRSKPTFTGSSGVFAPGWRNQISLSSAHPILTIHILAVAHLMIVPRST